MMHFQMVSMAVAKQPTAKVNQCYACHQTTSWNDIKGVGWGSVGISITEMNPGARKHTMIGWVCWARQYLRRF